MALVSKETKRLSLGRQCELLELPRSSYYYEPAPESEENLALMRRIDELPLQHPYYGVLRMQAELSTGEKPMNEKPLRRLMRKMGIETLYCKPNTSKPCKWHERFPYLLRGLEISRSNQVWSMDITYIPMRRGFMYLCGIIDWHSRYLLSGMLSNSLTVDFCVEALEQAIENYGKPEILNTDQGIEFTSDEFIEKVLGSNIRFSMDGKGRATDNACIERFWRNLKYEKIYLYAYQNSLDLFVGLTEYMDFYNNRRKHQSLGYQTPASVFAGEKEKKQREKESSVPELSINKILSAV
jgi:putative transposase